MNAARPLLCGWQVADRGRPKGSFASLERDLAGHLLARAAELAPVDDGTQWPSVKYQNDPVGFVREVLGAEPWDKQVEALEMLVKPGRKAIKSGRKTGKSTVAAWAALWFYCSFPRAQVLITAPHHKQVQDIIWKEVRYWHRRARIKIDGEPSLRPDAGLRSPDDRTIKGFVAVSKEGAQGYSGEQFYIVDEASGKALDPTFESIEGNRAGGAVRVLLLGNPTRTEGEFYDAFNSKSKFYATMTISSEDTPNVKAGRTIIPHLADPGWIEEMRIMHGVDSPFYKVHVLGEFAEGEEGKIITVELIISAQEAWEDANDDGPLVIGLDPAGAGPAGDETVLSPRRNKKLFTPYSYRALNVAGIIAQLEGVIKVLARDKNEKAIVVVDREGSIGAELYGALRARAAQPGAKFRVVGVRAGQRAERNSMVYLLTRDELWAAMADWLKEGGGIPEHTKLAKDLHAPAWGFDVRRRMTSTDKKELRKLLGRSPDYGDAACLSVWVRGDEPDETEIKPKKLEDARSVILDPYSAGGAIDPYGRR